MKICSICKIEKQEEDFHVKTKNLRNSYCKPCFSKYCINRWIRIKLEAIEYLGGKCSMCGFTGHYAAFQFHHLRDKKYQWSKIRLMGKVQRQEELDKCILLCANCHSITHSNSIH